jgi:hypothetical protein
MIANGPDTGSTPASREGTDPLDDPEHRDRADRIAQGVIHPRPARERQARDQSTGRECRRDEDRYFG